MSTARMKWALSLKTVRDATFTAAVGAASWFNWSHADQKDTCQAACVQGGVTMSVAVLEALENAIVVLETKPWKLKPWQMALIGVFLTGGVAGFSYAGYLTGAALLSMATSSVAAEVTIEEIGKAGLSMLGGLALSKAAKLQMLGFYARSKEICVSRCEKKEDDIYNIYPSPVLPGVFEDEYGTPSLTS